jgi:hypothetical protein
MKDQTAVLVYRVYSVKTIFRYEYVKRNKPYKGDVYVRLIVRVIRGRWR